MKALILVAALCAGCATATYTEPAQPTTQLGRQSAECNAYAAANSQVIISSRAWIGNAILSANKKKELYESCMEAHGYVKTQPAPASGYTAKSAPAGRPR